MLFLTTQHAKNEEMKPESFDTYQTKYLEQLPEKLGSLLAYTQAFMLSTTIQEVCIQ